MFLIDSFNTRKFYGIEKKSKTPTIDNLIENGCFFSQAISCADATLLSTTGLFTSQYPFRTGIRSPKKNLLDSDIKTNFEILNKNGFNLYGFRPTLQENDELFPEFLNQNNLYDVFENLSGDLGKKIFELIPKMKPPWFFLIHAHDLHPPIVVPKEFKNAEFGRNNYEKQISALDFWLGKILKKIDTKNTIIILTADHGSFFKTPLESESGQIEVDGKKEQIISKISNKVPKVFEPIKKTVFLKLENKKKRVREKIINELDLSENEKRNLLSGRFTELHTLFDDQIRIPLVFSGYNIKKNKEIPQQVRNIDIFPTIFEILSIPMTHKTDGESVYKLIDEKNMPENPIFLESNPLIIKKSNDVIGIRTSKFKFFRDKDDKNNRIHLYDLQNDPKENFNVYKNFPEEVNNFNKIIKQISGNFFDKNYE